MFMLHSFKKLIQFLVFSWNHDPLWSLVSEAHMNFVRDPEVFMIP